MELQLVIFNLAQEAFGVDISTVESIIKMQSITSMPHAPRFVEGITNLRGRILPVIDLRKRLDFPVSPITRDSRIIVADLAGMTVGMVVDGVNEVLRVNDDVVEPAPAVISSVDSDFIRGIAKIEERLVILLDLDRILNVREQADLAGMVADQ